MTLSVVENNRVFYAGAITTERRLIDEVRLTVPQDGFVRSTAQIALWRDANQVGKAQPVDAPVLTPTGWRAIGDLRPGDLVIAGDGTPAAVTAIHPQGERQVYRVTFDDGAEAECCEEHLWTIKDGEARFRKTSSRYGEWLTMTLGEIRSRWGDKPTARGRVAIPAPGPAQMEARPVPLDPYLLGLLIGDGCTSPRDQVSFTTADPELIDAIRAALPPGDRLTRRRSRYAWGIAGTRGVNRTMRALRSLGIMECRAPQKRVPGIYMVNSVDVRLAVLQGLMDTDGYCSAGGTMEFDSTSKGLAEDVVFLARSLGAKTKWSSKPSRYTNAEGQVVCSRMAYRVRIRLPGIRPFRLRRKLDRCLDPVSTTSDRVLYSIEPSRRAECVCIEVAHPSRTYVTSDFVVTHNSYGMAIDCVMFARGDHPEQTHRPPVGIAVCGFSWEQMTPLMEKIWLLCPKDELDPRNGFDPGRGITGKPPRLVFTSGPGTGSVIIFATYKQTAARLAGITLHRLYGDEPMGERFFGETIPRLFKNHGRARLGFTPTPDMPPVGYLREKCDLSPGSLGYIEEHNYGLTAANCHPIGSAVPWTTDRRIAEFEALLLSVERDQRMGRSWDPLVTERWLERMDDENIRSFSMGDILEVADAANSPTWLAVGIDHGAATGKQAMALVAIVGRDTPRPRVWYVDEIVVEGVTEPEEDARAIIAMLERNGLEYRHIDLWIGDRSTGSRRWDIKKSNYILKVELSAITRIPLQQMTPILDPRKKKGSEYTGIRILNHIFQRRTEDGTPHGLIHPQCEGLIASCKGYNGDEQDPLKDVLDAARYAVERSLAYSVRASFKALY